MRNPARVQLRISTMHIFVLYFLLTHFRFFTSLPIAEWLYGRDITCVGTLKTNRYGFQGIMDAQESQLDDVKSTGSPSTVFYHLQENPRFCVTSYVLKKGGKSNKVAVLSTHAQPIYKVTKDASKKPATIKLYDFTKGKFIT